MIIKRKVKKLGSLFLAAVLLMSGCGSQQKQAGREEVTTGANQQVEMENQKVEDTETTDKADATENADATGEDASKGEQKEGTEEAVVTEEVKVPEVPYIEVALNVYYNDADHSYYSNEAGSSIFITEEGTYTLSFDCAEDLSSAAVDAGVSSLTNLTAVYLLDMGAAKDAQSSLTACNIMYDSVKINDTELTVTQTEKKSAFKSSGLFDTNDPINAWDGSQVQEIEASEDHVANVVGISDPTSVSVTFTLSDMVWADATPTVDANAVDDTEGNEEMINTAVFHDLDFSNMDALSLTKLMGNGINLGNTFEAYGHTTLGTSASVRSYETYWGQPETTAKMFLGMKNCGFDSVRIPVAWTNMMDYENEDYTINTAYLDRVEEVVNYALDAELFVIINDHWDGGWWSMFGSKTPETLEKAWKIYESIWTQVGERFKDYSEMLIFESANEELGNSLNDNSHWADSGSLSMDECYQMTNQINQRFVDLIRGLGGKNENRFLLIAGYNTDFGMTVDSRYQMPTDTVDGKLILSVHYYTPWNYCGAEKQARWGLQSEYEEMNKLFAKLEKFTKAGYGVIIGEYAALPVYHSDNASSELKENTLEFTSNLLDNCDLYNYCPMLWSCNDFFQRKECKMISDEIAELFLNRRYEKEAANGRTEDEIKTAMEEVKSQAPTTWPDVKVIPQGAPVAWIMWNGGAGTYSVGDTYNPADNTVGIEATDVIVNGPGEYTVSLDFKEGNDGVTFAALAIANGENLFKKPVIDIKEILVDGKAIELVADPYTSSDDGNCTRVNLYNSWVNKVPDDARNVSGDLSNASSVIIDKTDMVGIKNITITFELVMN